MISQFTQILGGGRRITLWGEQANLSYFMQGFNTPDGPMGTVDKTTSFAASSAEMYPGDPNPIERTGGERRFMWDPARRTRRSLPGRTIILQELMGDQLEPGERRAFTLRGQWMDFHAYAVSSAKVDFKAFNNTGAYSLIKPA